MGTWAIVGTVIQLILRIIDMWLENDKAKKKAKQEALNAVQEGIKARDPSLITSGFDKYNRV
jgi:hypothetical protein